MVVTPVCSEPMNEATSTVWCTDGYELRYRVWTPSEPPACVMFLLNGLVSHSAWFRELAFFITSMGMKVVGADRRGSGINESQHGDLPSTQALLSDLDSIITKEADCGAMYIGGWCWGAAPAIHAALQWRAKLNGLVLLAPGLYPSIVLRLSTAEKLRGCADPADGASAVDSPMTEFMFSDLESVQQFIGSDSMVLRSFTLRSFNICRDLAEKAIVDLSKLTLPTLLLLAAKDRAVDNERTLDAFQRVRSLPFTTATLNCHHAMQLEVPDLIAEKLADWLSRIGAKSLLKEHHS
jgi:alpha-beta hydrolase superfamily lysophospholipase